MHSKGLKKTIVFFIFSFVFLIGCTRSTNHPIQSEYVNLDSDLKGIWNLSARSIGGENLFDLEVRFTTSSATSCIGGSWDKVEIISSEFFDNDTPDRGDRLRLNEKLSYNLYEGKIVIARNDLCDAYLRFKGSFDYRKTMGEYYIFDLSGKTVLGAFELTSK